MNFETEVIERSQEIPVVVDFWAPWCGPCQVLGPVIEELADEQKDKWALVKVNTDEQPDLMRQYGIRSIPAVKMFHRGEIVADFGGALPKFQIEKWLDEHLPSQEKMAFAEIQEQLRQDPDNLDALRTFTDEHPGFEDARVELAVRLVFRSTAEAQDMISEIKPGHRLFFKGEPLKHLIELMTLVENGAAVNQKLISAARAAKDQAHDQALEALISAVIADKAYQNELPRRATIAYFQWLGAGHELTKKYRKRFDMALY